MFQSLTFLLVFSFFFKGAFSYKDIDVLTMITLGQVTGRRKFELLTIVPADLKFEIVQTQGMTIRYLHLAYCWKKNLGVGFYNQKIMGTSNLEQDAITFVLLKLQQMGMITSAVAVYRGEEELKADNTLYESATMLQDKLLNTSVKLNKIQRIAFERAVEDPPQSLLTTLIHDESLTDPDYRMPFWVGFHAQLCSLTSNRMPQGTADEYISKFLCKKERNPVLHHGYTNSRQKRIGITSTRKAFRSETRGALSANANFDLSGHLSKQCSHTEAVGRSHYEDENEYQKSVPANIMQIKDGKIAEAAFMDSEHPPLYSQTGYHVPGHQFFTDELPSPEEFLKEQSTKLKISNELQCPVVGCDHKNKYRFYADLLDCHVNECHKTKKKVIKEWNENDCVICQACGSNITVGYFFGNHVLMNRQRGTCTKIGSNVFARKPVPSKSKAQAARKSAQAARKSGKTIR